MRTLVFCALLSVLGLVHAEDSVRSITTSGTAVIPYAPDHAFIPIMIDVETPSFAESEAQVTEIRAKVVDVLKKIGIPKGTSPATHGCFARTTSCATIASL